MTATTHHPQATGRLHPSRWFSQHTTPDPWPEAVSQVCALLDAGIAGPRAWDVVLATTNQQHSNQPNSNHHQATHRMRAHLAVHHNVPAALAAATTCYPDHTTPTTLRTTWAVWHIADACGAQLATALHAVTETATWEAELTSLRRQGLAAPQATIWVMATLPILGLLGALALGANPLAVLIGHPIGWALTTIGALCAAAGWCWGARLVRTATDHATIPTDAIIPMLSHTGLTSGATADQVLRETHTTASRIWPDQPWVADLGHTINHRALGAPWAHAHTPRADHSTQDGHSPLAATCQLLALAEETGAAAANLLLAHHRMRLTNHLAAAKETTAALGPQLVLPVAFGALPAFACWVILPTLWSLGTSLIPTG